MQVFEIPRQLCSTKDNKYIYITPVLYYCIVDAYKATFTVASLRDALEQRVLTTLEHYLRQRTQDSLLDQADRMLELCAHIMVDMAPDAMSWGVKIHELLVKEFKFAPIRAPACSDHTQGITLNLYETSNDASRSDSLA